MLDLEPDIFEFNLVVSFLYILRRCWGWIPAIDPDLCLTGIIKPEREIGVVKILIECLHYTTVIMPTDYDLMHIQVVNGIFQYRCKGPVMVRNNISNIPGNKKFSRSATGNPFGV